MEIQRIQALVEEAITASGAQSIETIVRGDKSRRVIEVYIDAESGVTTELCAAISRAAMEKLEEADPSMGNYRLEVSSPGIDRPLRFLWQYRKHVGRTLEVTLTPAEGPRTTSGILRSIDDSAVTIENKKSGAAERIVFTEIQQAIVKAPW